eukprot:XP_025000883.1 histone-lysine N-methyltransferase 2D-like [Gallus gallus]
MPNMSGRKKEAPKSGKPVCMLCRRARVDPDICGQTSADGGLCAHRFCLFFANGLLKWKRPTGGIFGFPPDAIQHTIQLADQKRCFVCRGKGAAISCAETGCERSFHLPCAEKGECVTQYFGQHRSFCCEHRPRQAAEAAPSHNTLCVICLEPVGDSTSYHTMVCPTCKQAWFHRGCIRKQAMHAATMLFVCPVCRGKARFRAKMAKLGIQIPVRLVSFCPALRTLRRRCCACPGAALAGRVPCHPASVGLSFMEKLGMSSRWMSRDALDLPHAYGSGGSSHSPSSLADDLGIPSTSSQMVGPQAPRVGPEDAVAPAIQQPEVLRAALAPRPDQHHRGPRGLPLCLHAGGNPGSEGGPTLEADPQWGVALRLPAAGPEEAVGAGPGSGDRPGHQAAPGPNIAEDVPAAGPKGGAEAATLFHPHVTVVLPSGKENKP